MKTLTTLTISIGMMLFLTTNAFAPPQPQPGQPGEGDGKNVIMDLLEESHMLMKDLAENKLPLGKTGEDTQYDQRKIIENFDELIQFVLDMGAEEIDGDEEEKKKEGKEKKKQTNPQNAGKKKPSGKPGGDDPAAVAGPGDKGQPKGGKYGDLSEKFEGETVDEWGLLPDREFEESEIIKRTIVPKGFDELLERFRRTVAKEGARLPK